MIKAIAITGPTASGKTVVSAELAARIGGEIISSDSMQIYKYMDIGTAKATESEMRGVKHHMLSFLEPNEEFSAEDYRDAAIRVAKEITEQGKIPIFAGGTGLYIDTLARGKMSEVPKASREYRDRALEGIKDERDAHALWLRLFEVDRESAEAIHENNVRRVIRALEIYDATGKPKSYFDKLSKEKNSEIELFVITIDFHERENLYRRVNKRVDKMMEDGLLSEVKALFDRGYLSEGTTAAQAIGYKELVAYLKGETSLCEAVELIKLSSRRYAKRQLTWFRHVDGRYTVYADDDNGKIRDIKDIVNETVLAVEKNKGFFSNEN